jgi:L-histidine N-alpha-methyltransferase
VDRLTFDVQVTNAQAATIFMEDVHAGMVSSRKFLLPKYFYDADGSELFEKITELPEYYPSRVETKLLASIVDDLVARIQPKEIVELGSGSSSKTQLLLNASQSSLKRYIPLDVSSSIVNSTAKRLLSKYPQLSIHAIIGDFEQHLAMIPPSIGRRTVLFLGSTLGNLNETSRLNLLQEIRKIVVPGDCVLLGVDLVKEVRILEEAYNDSQGVTAAFNRNILAVINKNLQADFQLEMFRHNAFYNEERSRIEMHLISQGNQTVRIKGLNLDVLFRPEESIWTESSYKFTRDAVENMLAHADLPLVQWYTDSEAQFGIAVASPE